MAGVDEASGGVDEEVSGGQLRVGSQGIGCSGTREPVKGQPSYSVTSNCASLVRQVPCIHGAQSGRRLDWVRRALRCHCTADNEVDWCVLPGFCFVASRLVCYRDPCLTGIVIVPNQR